jgi:hypothetical protein
MKAKYFRRLRKEIGKIQTYSIRETASLFGDFFGSNRIGLVMSDTEISASSPLRALVIYMRNYRRLNKQRNDYECEYYHETTERWGKVMVTDEKGFRHFFK